MKKIYLDITEFINFPVRTGLQRVVREVIRSWPRSHRLIPVKFCADLCLRAIPLEAVDFAVEYANENDVTIEEAQAQIEFLAGEETGPPVELSLHDTVLIPELFFDPRRLDFYKRAFSDGIDVAVIVPDFLLWLKPDLFSKLESLTGTMPYLMFLRQIKRRAFISSDVKRQFEQRVMRGSAGNGSIVIDLGADGLPIPKQSFRSDRKDLICLGTLQQRKAQHLVYEAFCQREDNRGLTLTFVGDVSYHADQELRPLLQNTRPDVRHLRSASDRDVVELFDNARASVYPATAEGYGLPPMESLWAGVPAVISADLPAISDRPGLGQIRLANVTVAEIRAALDELMDDAATENLWREASRYPNVTWKMTTDQIVKWIESKP